MEYDTLQTDDNLTTILFNNATNKTLELYAIRWQWDTSALNINKL